MIDIEEDTRESHVIGEYLDLVNQHGVSAPQTRLFLDVHSSSSALRAWAAAVTELEANETCSAWSVFFGASAAVIVTLTLVVAALLVARGMVTP